MNIILLTPLNVPFAQAQRAGDKLDPKLPIGLLSIGSYVKSVYDEIGIKIIDLNTEYPRISVKKDSSYEDFLDSVHWPFSCPDIIGISAMFSSNLVDLEATVAYLRGKFPNAIIVAGGHAAQLVPGLHAICYGEGEKPFSILVAADNKLKHLDMSPCWTTPTTKGTENQFVNLDSIPTFYLDMLRYPNDYSMTSTDSFTLGTKNPEPEIPMIATRGCRFSCLFCASQHIHGHKVRRRSSEMIKRDIDFYAKQGYRCFPFLDDDFFSDKAYAMDILQYIYDRGFKSRIFNVQYLHMDREILKMLKKTGSDRILITPDGLNEDFLRKVVKKPANFKKCKEVIQMAREVGLTTICNIIMGFPGETKEMIEKGVEEITQFDADWYAILVAVPFQGSELYEICKEKGYLATDDKDLDYHTAVIQTPEFTPKEIAWKAYETNLKVNFIQNRNMHKGNIGKAVEMFEQVLKIVPDHAVALQMISVCRWMQYQQAIDTNKFWMDWVDHLEL